jgi:hypothetical protein
VPGDRGGRDFAISVIAITTTNPITPKNTLSPLAPDPRTPFNVPADSTVVRVHTEIAAKLFSTIFGPRSRGTMVFFGIDSSSPERLLRLAEDGARWLFGLIPGGEPATSFCLTYLLSNPLDRSTPIVLQGFVCNVTNSRQP